MDHYEKRNGKERVWNFAGEVDKVWEFFPPVTPEEAIAQQRRNNDQIGKKDDPCLGRSYSELKKMGII